MLAARSARDQQGIGKEERRNGMAAPFAIDSIDFLLNPCIFGQIWQLYKSFARARGTSIPVIHQKVRPAMRTSDCNPLARTSSAFQPLSLDDLCRSDLYICHICPIQQGVMELICLTAPLPVVKPTLDHMQPRTLHWGTDPQRHNAMRQSAPRGAASHSDMA